MIYHAVSAWWRKNTKSFKIETEITNQERIAYPFNITCFRTLDAAAIICECSASEVEKEDSEKRGSWFNTLGVAASPLPRLPRTGFCGIGGFWSKTTGKISWAERVRSIGVGREFGTRGGARLCILCASITIIAFDLTGQQTPVASSNWSIALCQNCWERSRWKKIVRHGVWFSFVKVCLIMMGCLSK